MTMIEGTPDVSGRPPDLVQPSTDTIGMLRELVDALDRRVPRAERVGETRIAFEAAALRRAALNRIEELTRPGVEHAYDQGLAEAVMSDDGPARS
jgi:hypothetical protein